MSDRFYRPELDVVRFFAFITVFFHHAIPSVAGDSSIVVSVKSALGFGLCLFFTLSAYLITMLLMREKQRTETVSLKKFYLRRMLRIWPLYFLAIAIATVNALYFHRIHEQGKWIVLALVMAGNLIPVPDTVMAHIWSISVEEQFYILWPGLMKHISNAALVAAALLMLLISNTTLAWEGSKHAITDPNIWTNSLVQFEMFAVGILAACYDKKIAITRITRISFFVLASLGWFIANVVFHIKIFRLPAENGLSMCLGYGIVAIACALFIFAVKDLHIWPKWIIYLGKISYGLYIFHAIAIRIFHHFSSVPRCVSALATTISIAAFSYRFFETPFLRLKEKFEIIHSRPIESA